MSTIKTQLIINRPEGSLDFELAKFKKTAPRVLITGAGGSIGQEVQNKLKIMDVNHLVTDINELDVTNIESVNNVFGKYRPTHVLHLAADKHAPAGEEDPERTIAININGTQNIVNSGLSYQSQVILSSTCKACDPETVYGASKLIAERLVLNAGGRVARLFNVVETSGNVFEIWRDTGDTDDLVVTPCFRYFITLDEAVSLVLRVLTIQDNGRGGRYIFHPGEKQSMYEIAKRLYPERKHLRFPPRRGDRVEEPLTASCEEIKHVEGNLYSVHSPHDMK